MNSEQWTRKLFIHVGPPKTGTSAIQHFFRTHEDPRLLYPRVGLWADGAHHNLVHNFYQDLRRPETVESNIAQMFEAIGRGAKETSGNLLISSEALVGRDVGALVQALLPYLGDAPWQPELVIVFREHFGRVSSLYNQEVKDPFFRQCGQPDDYLKSHLHLYSDMVRRLRRFGTPISALSYHPSGTFVPRFLSYVGVSGRPAGTELRNVSLSVQGLIATLAVNNVAQTAEERRRYFEAVQRLQRFYAPSRFIFGRAAAEAAEVVFREDRQFIADEFGIALPVPDLSSQGNLFCLDGQELEEIAAVTCNLGAAGNAIVDFARKYLKPQVAGEPAASYEQATLEMTPRSRAPDEDIPVFAYWGSPDHTAISRTLADWRPHFPHFQVIGDADIAPLLEAYCPGFLDLYRAIRIPAAKSDVARLLALYEWGGLYVDCHCGIIDPEGVRRTLAKLAQFEAIFVDHAAARRDVGEYRIAASYMLARPKCPVFLTMAQNALANLERQRQLEDETGFVPYNILSLTGTAVIRAAITEPGSDNREIRSDLRDRILIIPEEGLPIARNRWKQYRVEGQQWHVRQETEPLFAPPPHKLPVFAYWDGPDHEAISPMLDDWRQHFPDFRVIGDAEVLPLVEKYCADRVEVYRAIRIPAARADVARLFALYEWGGLYVDCHYGVGDPAGVRRLIGRLAEFEAVFVDRETARRVPGTHWIVIGCMLARPKWPLFLAMARRALDNLEKQRQLEQKKGFAPYNIFALTGSAMVQGMITEPGTDEREWRRDLSGRMLIVPEEELPIQRDRWRTYTPQGQQWHIRQKSEPLFAAPSDSGQAPADEAETAPADEAETARADDAETARADEAEVPAGEAERAPAREREAAPPASHPARWWQDWAAELISRPLSHRGTGR